MSEEPELTEAQKAYNVAQYELFQLAAYGHYKHAPLIDTRTGKHLSTQEIEAGQRDYNGRIQAAREELEAAVLRLVAEHGEEYRTLPEPVVGWLRTLADDPAELSLLAIRPDEREEVRDEQPAAEVDAYEHTTGHLITCLAVAGGEADLDCPCQAEHDWIYRVTALPEDKDPQSQYYPSAHQARFWKGKVADVGYRTTVGRIPAEAFQPLSDDLLDRLAEEDRVRAEQRGGS